MALATYLAARILGTWELYLVAVAFLAALVVGWLLVARAGRRLTATRDLVPSQPTSGDELIVSFRVSNGSQLPGLLVTLPDATGDLSPSPETIEFASLGSLQERAAASASFSARRGVHHLPVLWAVAEDPLGLVRARRRLGEPLEVTIYPRLVDLHSCALFANVGAHRGLSRRGLVRLGSSEFRGIRPHYPGEPLSHVDWKATAKTGNLMLREMDDPESGDITVLLDGTALQVAGEGADSNFELAVEAAGSVADFVLAAGRGVNLLLHDGNWRNSRLTPDVSGHRRLLDDLAGVKAERQGAAVDGAAAAARRRRPPGAHADAGHRRPGARLRARALAHLAAQRRPAGLGRRGGGRLVPARRALVRRPKAADRPRGRRRTVPHAATRRRPAHRLVVRPGRTQPRGTASMKVSGRLAYFVCLAALAVVAALAMARVARPSIASAMVWAALLATAAGAPGLVRRRAWPLALPLLVAGAYLVARVQTPLPGDHGFLGLGFYVGQIRSGAHAYSTRAFPLPLFGAPGLRLLLTLVVYAGAGLASLLALGLRRPLAAIVVFLVLLGFSLTVDGAGSVVALPLTFLVLSGCLLALSRSLERARGTAEGVVAGAATAVVATVLALFLLVATPVAAEQALAGLEHVGVGRIEPVTSHLRLHVELSQPPRPQDQRAGLHGPVADPLVLASQRPRRLHRPGVAGARGEGCAARPRRRRRPRTPTTCRAACRPCRARRPSSSSSCSPCRPRSCCRAVFPRP